MCNFDEKLNPQLYVKYFSVFPIFTELFSKMSDTGIQYGKG